MCEVRVKKKSVKTPGVLLTLVPGKTTSNMWTMGEYSQDLVRLFKNGEVGIGMGHERGSRYYVLVLTNGGGIYSILESDLEIL